MAANKRLVDLAMRGSKYGAQRNIEDEARLERALEYERGRQRQQTRMANRQAQSQNAWWRPMARIGGMALGAGLGTLLAPATGGASLGIGTMLGASLGGGIGGEIANAGLPGNAGGSALMAGASPLLQYYAMQQLRGGGMGGQNPAQGSGWIGGNYYGPDYEV